MIWYDRSMAKCTTPPPSPATPARPGLRGGRVGFLAGVIMLAWFALPRPVAAATTPVTGWAWSSVAGWISMSSENCRPSTENPDPCALGGASIAPYGAMIDEQGVITGYTVVTKPTKEFVDATERLLAMYDRDERLMPLLLDTAERIIRQEQTNLHYA